MIIRVAVCAMLFALVATVRPASALDVGLELVADGLAQPVALASPPDDERRFIVEQIGRIRILTGDGRLLEEPFLDIRKRLVELNRNVDERGLLGLAFHPQFATNGRFYVYYSAPLRSDTPHPDWDHTSRIAEFKVSADDPDRADPASERLILQIDQPRRFHNAGALAFGPEGHLYIAVGDGGDMWIWGEGDTALGNAQEPDRLLGKVLRIDVSGHPYSIPDDNPFVGEHRYRPEIYALGLRNPYRCAFDAGGERALLCGDVGEGSYEEVNLVRAGGNYGWPIREGRHCFEPETPLKHPRGCGADGLIDPVVELVNCRMREDCHGRSIIGGYVYRGDGVPELTGRYVFGDWAAEMDGLGPALFAASRGEGGGAWSFEPLTVTNLRFHSYVTGFGQDAEHELYVLAGNALDPRKTKGKVYKIVPVHLAHRRGGEDAFDDARHVGGVRVRRGGRERAAAGRRTGGGHRAKRRRAL